MGTYGTTADWIELCNSSDETISLSKYSIYDRGSDPGRFVLPDVKLNPGAYYVLLVKSDPTNLSRNYEVLPFNLSSEVQNDSYAEVIYELGVPGKASALLCSVKALPGVSNVSLVDCRKG